MAYIDDLLAKVLDPDLRRALLLEVSRIRSRRSFGLVFERHIPETGALPGLRPHKGSFVVLRDNPGVEFVVEDVNPERAILRDRVTGTKTEAHQRDLLVIATLGRPIFPALVSVGSVERSSERPFHAVINGENYHALQLFSYLFEQQVDCIYIDPPYNTGATHWKYNNRFVDQNDEWRHSKFLAFLERRLTLAKRLLRSDGVLIITIDKHELHHVGMLLESIFPEYDQHIVSIVINPKGTNEDNFARTNEYALFCVPPKGRVGREVIAGRVSQIEDDRPSDTLDIDEGGLFVEEEADDNDNGEIELTDDNGYEHWGLIRGGQESSKRPARPNQFYPLYIDEANAAIVDVGAAVPANVSDYPRGHDERGLLIVYPMGKDGVTERVWRYEAGRMRREIAAGTVRIKKSSVGRWTFALRRPKKEVKRVRTSWWDSLHDAGLNGSAMLERFVPGSEFPFPKSVYAVRDCLDAVCRTRPDALILDFFAGSGTTLHATALLNADDGGQRRCVLVTNNELDPKVERALRAKGLRPGDEEYERQGIFFHVTVPRCLAAITGHRLDGSPVAGHYRNRITRKETKHSFADGFVENIEFFRLDYLDKEYVELGKAFDAINPCLWLTSGARGLRHIDPEGHGWAIASGGSYAVLFDDIQIRPFAKALSHLTSLRRVFLVTDSEEAYAEMVDALGGQWPTSMLYRDYLRNFQINTAETT